MTSSSVPEDNTIASLAAHVVQHYTEKNIPVLIINNQGGIEAFTPKIDEFFAIDQADLGQAVSNMARHFSGSDLARQIERTYQSNKISETTIQRLSDSSFWLMRMDPTVAGLQSLGALVISFIDGQSVKDADSEYEQRFIALKSIYNMLTLSLKGELSEENRSGEAWEDKTLEQRMTAKARQLLVRQLLLKQEEERRRIAHDIHDQLGQDLTALILGLHKAHDSLPERSEVKQRLLALQNQAVRLGQQVQTLAFQIRPAALEQLGLLVSLQDYIQRWARQAEIKADFQQIDLDEQQLHRSLASMLYRLVQEALNNVLKHAHAQHVNVIIQQRPAELSLIIEDDGIGFDVQATQQPSQRGQGLISMQERIALVDGRLIIESPSGGGTTLFIRIPLDAIEDD
jgi:two-component system CheB/CheR fusion protein